MKPPPSTITPLPTHVSTALDDIAPGAKVLWVGSTGGHLAELGRLEQRLEASPESLWVTFETPQSTMALADKRTYFVDYVAPRDLTGTLRAAAKVLPILRREHFDLCVSTGAAVAASILPMAAWAGIPTYYLESLARPTAPSFTGRLMAYAPRVRTLTQYPAWASGTWPYHRSVLDDWTVSSTPPPSGPLNVLVTLGTIHPYRFDRAVDAVRSVLHDDDRVTWQLGCTTRDDLPGMMLGQVSPTEMSELSLDADVVVAHAGVGSILQQFELGKSPVLAVRSRAHQEHVDDHQLEFAQTTAERGLTTIFDLDAPSRESLVQASGRRVLSSLHEPAGVAG